MIEQAIADLLGYALRAGLIEDCDRTWAANRLLEALKLDNWAFEQMTQGSFGICAARRSTLPNSALI